MGRRAQVMTSRFLLLAACSWTMAGCSSVAHEDARRIGYAADGEVGAEIVDAPAGARYQAVAGSAYFNPLPVRENAKPDYPSALLARRLPPASVVARLVVDGTGAVERATVVETSGDDRAFADAVLSTVKTWTFIPLKRITGDRIERLPFTQDYRFVFRQVNGRAVVESGVAGAD